jgi:hypothetical protein
MGKNKLQGERKMKRNTLVLAIILLFLCSPAFATTLAWDEHTDTSVTGYLLQWAETSNPPEIFSMNVPGITTTQKDIPDNYFKLDVQYDVWVKAYNTAGESGKSNVVNATRTAYTPTPDNIPTVTYDAPGAVINFTNQ